MIKKDASSNIVIAKKMSRVIAPQLKHDWKNQQLLVKSAVTALLIFLSLIVFSASSFAQTIKIGTLNIKWFGKNPKKTDMNMLFTTIKNSGVDVLGVQEIVNTTRLQEMAEEMLGSDWKFSYAKDNDQQKVGILYNNSEVEASKFEIFSQIDITGRLRPAYKGYFEARKGNFHFNLIVVHLDSGADESDIANREEQWKRLAELALNLTGPRQENNVILLGDMNCLNKGGEDISELDAFQEETGFKLITDSLPFTHYYRQDNECARLDHIFISPGITNGKVTVGGPCNSGKCDDNPYFQKVSDHCIVSASFDVRETRKTVVAEKEQNVIGNIKTKIFHRPDSPSVSKIIEENRVKFKSKEEALAAGYRPAKNVSW